MKWRELVLLVALNRHLSMSTGSSVRCKTLFGNPVTNGNPPFSRSIFFEVCSGKDIMLFPVFQKRSDTAGEFGAGRSVPHAVGAISRHHAWLGQQTERCCRARERRRGIRQQYRLVFETTLRVEPLPAFRGHPELLETTIAFRVTRGGGRRCRGLSSHRDGRPRVTAEPAGG